MEDITVIRSNRKTIGIQVRPNGEVVVRVPLKYPEYKIHQAIQRYGTWIREKRDAVKRRYLETPVRKFEDGEELLYLGVTYPLRYHSIDVDSVWLDDCINIPSHKKDNPKKVLSDWYREQARLVFLDRVCYYTAKTGVRAVSIRLNTAKTRWGSCSVRGTLNFNWKLIMAPADILEYVVVHEVVHIQEHNHSPQFWKKVEEHYPEYKKAKKWLKDNGHLLHW